jgi:hypothetical protein
VKQPVQQQQQQQPKKIVYTFCTNKKSAFNFIYFGFAKIINDLFSSPHMLGVFARKIDKTIFTFHVFGCESLGF